MSLSLFLILYGQSCTWITEGTLFGFERKTLILGALFLIAGICSSYQIPILYKAGTYVAPSMMTLATAWANMMIMSFGFLFHTGIGKLMVHFWDGKMDKGIPIYSTETYVKALEIIPYASLAGALGFIIFVKRAKKRGRL